MVCVARRQWWCGQIEVWARSKNGTSVAASPTPHIFVGATTSPRNIRGLYSSVRWPH
jgi:hypothetical protein